MRAILCGLAAATLLAVGCARGSGATFVPPPAQTAGERRSLPPVPAGALPARVLSVTDGDTIVLRGIGVGEIHHATGGRKARLIGVDTPEVFGPDECFGTRASSFTKAELGASDVRVVFDVGRTDRYGRALVYVWDSEGRFFNARLVQEGYALQMTVPPNVRYADLFTELAREARRAGRGLWSEC